MLIEQTLQKIRAIKLHGFANALEQQLAQPDIQQLSFEERIGLLIDGSSSTVPIEKSANS